MANLPECFCNSEAMQSCKWKVEITAKYSNPDFPEAVVSTVPWTLENIPQPLAQAIVQSSIKVTNENGLDVYVVWLEECGQAEMAATVRKAARL